MTCLEFWAEMGLDLAGACGSRCGYTDVQIQAIYNLNNPDPTEQMRATPRDYANLWNEINNINADALRWIYGHGFLFGYNDPELPVRTSLNDFFELLRAIRQAFPDSQFTIVDIIMDGINVSIQFTWTGTHTGMFEYRSISLPPTDEVVTTHGVIIQSISSRTNFVVTKEIWYVDFPFLREFEQRAAQ